MGFDITKYRTGTKNTSRKESGEERNPASKINDYMQYYFLAWKLYYRIKRSDQKRLHYVCRLTFSAKFQQNKRFKIH